MSKYRINFEGQTYILDIEKIEEGSVQDFDMMQLESRVVLPEAVASLYSAESDQTPQIVTVRSSLSGTVVDILVPEGTHVEAGDPVLTLEAMKMENDITAPKSGVVTRLMVNVHQTVASGTALFEIQ